jgi:hypothetical protein
MSECLFMADKLFVVTDVIQAAVINRSKQIRFGRFIPFKFNAVFPNADEYIVDNFFGGIEISRVFTGKIA